MIIKEIDQKLWSKKTKKKSDDRFKIWSVYKERMISKYDNRKQAINWV